jgi:hypothetical protein
MPTPLKDPSVRRRRNRESTATELTRRKGGRRPTIPIRHAHPQTRAWWADVWNSPMAGQYVDADKHGLMAMCLLVEDFWTAGSAKERRELAAELRQQGVRFGLSPIDRRRLQWSLPQGPAKPEAKASPGRGRARPGLAVVPAGPDPRSVLTA